MKVKDTARLSLRLFIVLHILVVIGGYTFRESKGGAKYIGGGRPSFLRRGNRRKEKREPWSTGINEESLAVSSGVFPPSCCGEAGGGTA
jgi:hypothetical protein